MTEENKALVPATDSSVEEYEPRTEIIQLSALEHLIAPVRNSPLPIHEQFLQGVEDDELRMAIANAYYGSEPLSFKLFAGKEKTVLGMILFEHGPYKANSKDQEMMPGYFQVQILLEDQDEEGRPKVVKSASMKLAMHVCTILKSKGWFLFPEPRKMIFALGANGAHFLFDKDSTLKRSKS